MPPARPPRGRGFTLVELLVVVAILAALAALLLPAMTAARAGARGAACLSSFGSVGRATAAYLGDYDDLFPPIEHGRTESGRPRTWVQATLPYARSFEAFLCPEDATRASAASYDPELVVGDVDDRLSDLSRRVNTGYNSQNLAPVVRRPDGVWEARPRSASTMERPSDTLMFVDSIGPTGEAGGSYLVVPPCRFAREAGRTVDTFTREDDAPPVYSLLPGWRADDPHARYGGAWPWHGDRATTVALDVSARPLSPARLAAGCEVRPQWAGVITDPAVYRWDAR